MVGNLIIVVGANASGKSSIVHETQKRVKCLSVIRYTTRERSVSEQNGKHYYFVSAEKFTQMIESESFLEYEQYPMGLYGTAKKDIVQSLSQGHVLMESTPRSLIAMRKFCLSEKIPLIVVYILPCKRSLRDAEINRRVFLEALRGRMILRGKASDSAPSEVMSRLRAAIRGLAVLQECDLVIENSEGCFEDSVCQLITCLEK